MPVSDGQLCVSLVCPQTEERLYNDAFLESQDIVVNALDNVEARRYVDRWDLALPYTSPQCDVFTNVAYIWYITDHDTSTAATNVHIYQYNVLIVFMFA